MANSAPSLPIALTIAGFDPSGGAGITADLAVFAAHGIYGISAVSLWTAQSTRGVFATREADAAFLRRSLEVLWDDLPPLGVKIGALGGRTSTDVVARCLEPTVEVTPRKTKRNTVLDPVLVSTFGRDLYAPEDVPVMLDRLLPLVDWVTPNWGELAVLASRPVRKPAEVQAAAEILSARFPNLNVVATGGDQARPIEYVLLRDGSWHEFPGQHIAGTSTHGTGCAFSTALLANLVLGKEPLEAVRRAKEFVAEGIRRAPRIGHGRGPLDLLWPLRNPEPGR